MDFPYLLLPVVLISSFLYLLSFLFVRMDIISVITHRKLWNSVLLITFLATAILGLLLVVQINYKLEWAFVKAILKWHVDFGIAMSFAAVIHLTWHYKYYLKLVKSDKKDDQGNHFMSKNENEKIQKLSLIILLSGFISTVVQVLLLREITTIFQGNELMLAWALGIWMLLTGTGAFMGRKLKTEINYKHIIKIVFITIAIVPFVNLIVLILIKNSLFPPGMLVHPLWFILIVFVLFSPICLLSGLLFPVFTRVSGNNKNNFIKVYAYETIGCLFGGLAVSFLLIKWIDVPGSLIIISVIIFIILFYVFRKKIFLLGIFLSLLVLFMFQVFPLSNLIKNSLFNNQKILVSKETTHGNITITENAGQYNIFDNGNLFFSTDNNILSEEYVHYAMLQHKNPKSVLLVSGGMSGMVYEILKYPGIENINYIEPNPQLIPLLSKYIAPANDKRVHFYNGDPRKYIKIAKEKYDVVIMAIADPTSLQINRLYTLEFMQGLKECISPGGIVLYGISSAGNYLGKEKKEIAAAIFYNLKENFRFIAIIPGERDYYIASDSAVSKKIGELSAGWEDKNLYVNPYYMDDESISRRNDFIINSIKNHQTINTDERPTLVFSQSMQFISKFGQTKGWIILLPLILLLTPLFFMKSYARGMFVAGLTASSIEITLIFIFQLIFGYIYSAIGVIIAVFMGGLAIGAIAANKFTKFKNTLPMIILLLAISLAIVPVCFRLMNNIAEFARIIIILINILLPSFLTGFLFTTYTNRLSVEKVNAPTLIYASDLFGSAFGVIAVTVYLLPVWGISNTCYILAGINLLPLFTNYKR